VSESSVVADLAFHDQLRLPCPDVVSPVIKSVFFRVALYTLLYIYIQTANFVTISYFQQQDFR